MLEDSRHKVSEQYPLLMVAGAGDAAVLTPPPAPRIWTTTMTPRRAWKERWPEYLSTCWMTLILLGISFLVFYSIVMAVFCRHEGYLLVKCNDTKPASEVFYHHIVPRGGDFPLSYYEDYLSDVARQYPLLRFNVYFLIDDTNKIKSSILEKIYTYNSAEYNLYNKREVRVLQRKFPNINILVISLSRFMAGTPLRYKWRRIPIQYIPFYCRVFAVWLNGGVGLDLAEHNEQYRMDNPQRIDRKARALLEQHNEGISPEKYMKTVLRLEREDEAEYFDSFICFMHKMIKDTISYFTSISPLDTSERPMEPALTPFADTKFLVRTHRTKRETLGVKQEASPDNDTSKPAEINIVFNQSVVNVTAESNKNNLYQTVEIPFKEIPTPELALTDNGWYSTKIPQKVNSEVGSPENRLETEKKKSVGPQIVLFYDFPSEEAKPLPSDIHYNPNEYRSPLKVVTIGAEGSFVASTGRMHPFLGVILSAGCKRLAPKFAIQNAFMSRCTGSSYKDDICNNIHIL